MLNLFFINVLNHGSWLVRHLPLGVFQPFAMII